MQPSERQKELEKFDTSRRHVPHISISDDDHHVTEAIGSYYDEPASPPAMSDPRPLSFISSPSEAYERTPLNKSKRNGSYFDPRQQRIPLTRTVSDEQLPSVNENGGGSPNSVKRVDNGNGSSPGSPSPTVSLTRQSSTDTAIQQFPLNDIDYESSPAAVAQELSNLQAIRRMSMNVDAADPDLPSFGGGLGLVPTVAPKRNQDENDTSRLFWVPARLHPELAPKEFKTFIEDRVEIIRRRSGDSDSLSPDGVERSGSGSSLRRKKSMLSRQIDTPDSYEDGAERLERRRSKGMSLERQTQVDLEELETLVNDPAQLMRRMSLDTARRSLDSGVEVPANEDMPMLPPGGQSLKRSTRTTYRRGSLKKGERVPFPKRLQQRLAETEADESSAQSPPIASADEPPIRGLTRVQTEPIPQPSSSKQMYPSRTESSLRWREMHGQQPQPNDSLVGEPSSQGIREDGVSSAPHDDDQTTPRPQPRQFQSRLASGGRTTAQLPGYNNQNPLPQIFETLPDGSNAPVTDQTQPHPERKSSHDLPRPAKRGGAHMRPVPGREQPQRSSTLDDISSRPSPLPGSGNTSTDALTMVPTFDDRKAEKKEGPRKSSWTKWGFGKDDEKKSREDNASDAASIKSGKSGKLNKASAEKARLDVLQSSIDGNVPSRGRESLVLSRDDVRLDEERKKEGKKASEGKKDKDGLLSAIFGGKKKSSDGDLKEKKRRADRNLSPEPALRILKPDIDYNWTRFSILEERAIYRMAHMKLANPRRALYSQVLLSNFMYSYLAKVQMMHPQVQIPPAHQKSQQRHKQEEQQPVEYSQYQRWQQDQEASNSNPSTDRRRSRDYATGGASPQSTSYDYEDESATGYDTRSSEEYEYDHSYQQQHPEQSSGWPNGVGSTGRGNYSVAGSRDYLGYPKDKQPFESSGLWDDDEKSEELW